VIYLDLPCQFPPIPNSPLPVYLLPPVCLPAHLSSRFPTCHPVTLSSLDRLPLHPAPHVLFGPFCLFFMSQHNKFIHALTKSHQAMADPIGQLANQMNRLTNRLVPPASLAQLAPPVPSSPSPVSVPSQESDAADPEYIFRDGNKC